MLVAFLSSGWGRVSLILAPFLFCFGLYATINPHGAAFWGRRWSFKGNPEAGGTLLFLVRLGGIMMILVVLALGLFLLVGSFLYHYEY
jgi:hypothetical protein